MSRRVVVLGQGICTHLDTNNLTKRRYSHKAQAINRLHGRLVLECSTAHMSVTDEHILRKERDPLPNCRVLDTQPGWLILMSNSPVADAHADLSKQLKSLIEWADECGFDWLHLTPDAAAIEGREQFDW